MPALVNIKANASAGKGFCRDFVDFLRGRVKAGDVVYELRKVFLVGFLKGNERFYRVRHDHKRQTGIRTDKAAIGYAFCGSVQHLGAVIAGAAGWDRFRANEPRKTQAAEIYCRSGCGIRGKLAVVFAVIAPEVFAIQFVAAVHRGRKHVLGLFNLADLRFTSQRVHPVSGDRAGVDEFDRIALPLRLLHRQTQQVQRPFHVDAVGGFRVVFSFGGEN